MTCELDILVVDDDHSQADLLAEALGRFGHHAVPCRDPETALLQLRTRGAHLVITDLRMPKMDGIEFLKKLKGVDPDLDVLLVTGFATVQTAVEAMRLGALDYLEKPVDLSLLKAKLLLVSERVALRRENRALRAQVARLSGDSELLGQDPKFLMVVEQIERVAPSDAPVLLIGETGTGKELLARRLHEHSPRAARPFIAVNCGAIPEHLIESEFFGHARGAFTGADRVRIGRIEEASGGTLFLDEIGELPIALQPKLLRVLQNQEFCRLGDNQVRKADVRWVAATHRNLQAMIREGAFREDLYYRLAVLPLTIPPLRERTGDLPLLMRELMARKAKTSRLPVKHLTPEALEALCGWKWPGNVRELENTIERLLLLTPGPLIDLGDLPEEFGENVEPSTGRGETPKRVLESESPGSLSENGSGESLVGRVMALERSLIAEALAESGGNQSEAARRLGIHERTLRYKLRKLGIPSAGRG